MYGLSALSALSDKLSNGQTMMDSLVQYLMSKSTLDVVAVNIRNATKDSFSISIECRVSGTGPVSSVISPMDVDLLFNGSRFGRMRLPEIHTSVWGTTILILEQTVHISDLEAYKSYVRSTIVEEATSFTLSDGDCRVAALGLKAQCKYEMDVPMKGMAGLSAEVKDLTRQGDEVAVKVEFRNPSPVQIDHRVTLFELRTATGEVVARLQGNLEILRGIFTVQLHGALEVPANDLVQAPVATTSTTLVRLVGAGVKEASWCDETIRNLDLALSLTADQQRLLSLP